MASKTSTKWGVFLGIGLVVGTQMLTWLGLGLTFWFPLLTYLCVIVFVAIALANIRRIDDGRLTIATAAWSVLMIILISRFIFQAYMFVYINFIDPNWVNDVAELWTTKMKEADIPADQIDRRIEIFRQSWKTIPMFTVEVFIYAIPQFVLGMITALFFVLTKKLPENVDGKSNADHANESRP